MQHQSCNLERRYITKFEALFDTNLGLIGLISLHMNLLSRILVSFVILLHGWLSKSQHKLENKKVEIEALLLNVTYWLSRL